MKWVSFEVFNYLNKDVKAMIGITDYFPFFPPRPMTGDRPMRGRGGGRGGRGGRGRGIGRGDGFDSRGKREFDRHSGSDRSYVPFQYLDLLL